MKVKLTALVVVLVAIATYTFGKFTITSVMDTLSRAAGSGVLTAASMLAESIDPAWLTGFAPQAGPDAEYNRLQTKFKKLLGDGYVIRLELIRLVGRTTVQHIINVPADNSKDYRPLGMNEPLVGGTLYSQESEGYHVWTMESTPGTFFVAWVPFFSNGEQVGLLAMYINANEIQDSLMVISTTIFVVMLLLVFLSGAFTYRLASSFEKVAVTDGLMGIYNRKYFNQRLDQEVARSKRYSQKTSLVMMDIDFFKRVNDTYGHATGDITLKSLAKWVTESVRSTDVVCRYGGEEIAVILSHTGIAGAQEFAERLRMKISEQYVKDPGEGVQFRVTVSMGVAQYEKGISDATGLVKRADAALYHSKNTGRNRVTIYTDDLHMEPEKPVAAAADHH